MFNSKLFYRRRHHKNRRAVATVEAAICLPALFILTIGTIDLCSLIFLKEAVTLAAYEGAREGVGRGHTNADAVSRVTEFLDDRDINYTGNVVTISAPGFDAAETLENVTVTVTVPSAGNLISPADLFPGLDITASVTMRKEYANLTP